MPAGRNDFVNSGRPGRQRDNKRQTETPGRSNRAGVVICLRRLRSGFAFGPRLTYTLRPGFGPCWDGPGIVWLTCAPVRHAAWPRQFRVSTGLEIPSRWPSRKRLGAAVAAAEARIVPAVAATADAFYNATCGRKSPMCPAAIQSAFCRRPRGFSIGNKRYEFGYCAW